MKRISTNMPNMDMSYHMRLREWKMNKLQNKMASQTRIKELRDDPIAAGHSTRYKSKIARLQRLTENIGVVRGELALVEGNLRSGLDVIHRIRELAVQGANGIYSKEQLAFMGQEVDQLLNELVQIANARSSQGNYLFSGHRSAVEPFRVHTGRVEGSQGGEVATTVEYVGDIGRNQAEIAESAFLQYQIPGNYAFWAEQQQIYSDQEASEYRVQQDATIRLDGQDIALKEGDTIHAVISKINASHAPVRAHLDPVKNALVLETTFAHQLWPEDVGDSTVLQDLGILNTGTQAPPLNVADSADVFGGSMFDMIMYLRDSLYSGDALNVGGAGLRGIDHSLEVMTTNLAELGSQDNRLQQTASRLDYEIPEYTKFDSEEVDLDLSQAITELKMLEYTHKAAVATAARILQPTLLDFLR